MENTNHIMTVTLFTYRGQNYVPVSEFQEWVTRSFEAEKSAGKTSTAKAEKAVDDAWERNR